MSEPVSLFVVDKLVQFQIFPKSNLGQHKFQKIGRIGSTEMYLIWEVFGIMVMSSGLIIITGSNKNK